MAQAPEWLRDLLGWKSATVKTRRACESLFREPVAPNLSDLASRPSLHLAGHVYETIGVPITKRAQSLEEDSPASGTLLEKAIEDDLSAALPAKDADRSWVVSRRRTVADFEPDHSERAPWLRLSAEARTDGSMVSGLPCLATRIVGRGYRTDARESEHRLSKSQRSQRFLGSEPLRFLGRE